MRAAVPLTRAGRSQAEHRFPGASWDPSGALLSGPGEPAESQPQKPGKGRPGRPQEPPARLESKALAGLRKTVRHNLSRATRYLAKEVWSGAPDPSTSWSSWDQLMVPATPLEKREGFMPSRIQTWNLQVLPLHRGPPIVGTLAPEVLVPSRSIEIPPPEMIFTSLL